MMRRLEYRRPSRRSGFTMVELLVVTAVLLILMTFTAAAVNYALTGEKTGSGARQVQSYLEGARDRAILAKEARGVRFLPDVADGRLVSSLVFIGPSEPWNDGNIQLQRIDAMTTRADLVAASPDSGWWELAQRRLLYRGLRLRVPNDRSGSWYTIVDFVGPAWGEPTPPIFDPGDGDASNDDPFPLKVQISPPFRDPATNAVGELQAFAGGGPNTYSLELPPVILPEKPVLFPKGVVIDLDASAIPSNWPVRWLSTVADPSNPSGQARPAYMDVMFSPRGTVTGGSASRGLLHFYVTELTSVDSFRTYVEQIIPRPPSQPPAWQVFGQADPIVPADDVAGEPIGDRSLISVFTQTGTISTHPINPIDVSDPADVNNNGNVNEPDGVADDPFYFAETAEVGKQ